MKRHTLYLILALLCLSLLSSCAYNEATDSKQFNWVSEEKEIKLGKQAHQQIMQEHGLYKDEALSAYVSKVGKRVALASGRPNLEYHFTVLDAPLINAFALPGGYVYVTRGILANMNSEAELAFVLGHEVAHVAAKHGAQRMTQAQSVGALLTAASILLDGDSAKYTNVVGKVAELSVLGYGRKNEHESDLLGVDYAMDAGYDPEAGSVFLKTLDKQSKYKDELLSRVHSSHPPTKERIKQVKDKLDIYANSTTQNYTGLDVKRDAYLEEIDNIFTGKSPLTGTRKEGVYQNPQLGFKMDIPEKWEIQGTLEKPIVKMRLKSGITGTLFREALLPQETLLDFRDRFKDEKERDLPALTTKSGVLFEKSTVRDDNLSHLTYYTIRNNIGIIFYFQMPHTAPEIRAELDTLIDSFTYLSKEEMKEETRLTIHTVKSGDTFETLTKSYYGNTERIFEVADFNQLSPGSPLIPGTLIKIP